MLQTNISQNFLYNFHENGFYSGFTNTTRPYNITTDKKKENKPMNIKQLFTWDCLKYYYNEIKNIFKISNSKTRNKAILLPKIDKRVSEEKQSHNAIKTFNQLPNELKTLEIDKRSTMFKLKKLIVDNIY